MDGFMEITVSTGTCITDTVREKVCKPDIGYRRARPAIRNNEGYLTRGVSLATLYKPQHTMDLRAFPKGCRGLKSCETSATPPAGAEKSPILVPRTTTPRYEETEISITLFYLLIH